MNKLSGLIFSTIILLASCSNNKDKSDAFGNFEATETIISSEISGKILNIYFEEGQYVDSGIVLCKSDSNTFALQKQLIIAQKNAAASKYSDIIAQVNVLKEQKKVAMIEKMRIYKLFADSAATQKQLDDIEGRIKILDKQIEQVKNQNKSLFDQLKTYDVQIELANDLLSKTTVKSLLRGLIVSKYIEKYELLVPGKPICKIADIENMILRAYISGTQISELKIGQKVHVIFDKTANENQAKEGIVQWISDKAEFTPKIIQTKDERVNFVYAVKIMVKNDGKIKIGMPGELKF
jgi:HlyD family secretion protein